MTSMKRIAMLVIVASVMMGWTSQKSLAAANVNKTSAISLGIALDDPPNEMIVRLDDTSTLASQYLMGGSCLIGDLTNKNLSVSGNSKAYMVVDSIRVELYLQRWNVTNSKWEDVLAVGSTTDYGSSFISSTKEVKALRGYYYRTRAVHRTVHKGIVEQFTSVSTQVYAGE